MDLKNEFEQWFTRLLLDTERSRSCFWRDVLRGSKLDLYNEYLRLNAGGEPRLTTISDRRA